MTLLHLALLTVAALFAVTGTFVAYLQRPARRRKPPVVQAPPGRRLEVIEGGRR